MNALAMHDVLKSVRELPSLPIIVADLLAQLGDDNADSRMLADKLARDQALTAKTLRLANSSFYGLQHKVGTIGQAIAILGFDSVRTLVTAAAIIGNFSAIRCGGFDFHRFWHHGVATALAAKALARQLQLNQDQAFLAGLLHDIGRLILVIHSPAQYTQVLQYRKLHDCSVMVAEQALLGLDHGMAGRALAEHWKFPAAMQSAIGAHHQPDLGEPGSMAALIQVADAIAHALDLCEDGDEAVPLLDPQVWQALKIDRDMLQPVFRDIDRQFEEACQIMAA